MWPMTFQLPPGVPQEVAQPLEWSCLAGGPDNMPLATQVSLQNGLLRLQHSGDESVYLVAPWPVEGVGQVMGTSATLRMYGDWTDRIAKGELPKSKPERPQGVERNVVVTVWDWSSPTAYLHDAIATDPRNPTINANGPIFGATENSTDELPEFIPSKDTVTEVKIPVRDPKTPSTKEDPMLAPSPYNGPDPIWDSQAVVHNPMYDEQGNIWFTARIRPAANPDFCKKGSDLESAKLFPLATSGRQLAMMDVKTGKFTLINTCFPTHHLEFGFDKNDTLWTSAGGPQANVVGWLNTKMFRETGDEQKSQGWTALIVDTNGKGKREGGFAEIRFRRWGARMKRDCSATNSGSAFEATGSTKTRAMEGHTRDCPRPKILAK